MIIHKLLFRIIFVLLCLVTKNGLSQDLFDRVHSLKYCNYLLKNNQYEAAFSEFERLKFYSYVNDTIYTKVIFTYSKLLRENELKLTYDEAKNKFKNSTLLRSAYFVSNPDQKKISYLIEELKKDTILTTQEKTETQLKLLVKNNMWNEASDFMVGNPFLTNQQKTILFPVITEGAHTKFKSPFIGALLSSIVPGSGKLYAGEKADGIISMISVSALVAGAIHSYTLSPESPWTYVLGGLSIGFYTGNIYGSFHSVKKTNKQKQLNLNEESHKAFTDF